MIRNKLVILTAFILSIAMISYGTVSEGVEKKPRSIMPIAVSIVDNTPYVYGLVDTSPYKVSIRIPPEQYVIAMSGEPITMNLSNNDIRKPDKNWEGLSLFLGILLMAVLIFIVSEGGNDDT